MIGWVEDMMQFRVGIKEKMKVSGAYVNAVAGLYEDVCVLDIASLYPSILLSFNMSNETVVELDKNHTNTLPFWAKIPEKNIGFLDKKGFIPDTIRELMDLRKEWKKQRNEEKDLEKYRVLDQKQFALKTIINTASYGALLYPRFRLYDKRIGEAIPYIGRKIALWIRRVVEDMGYKVVNQDTDSVFVLAEKDKGFEIEKRINESFDEFAKQYEIKQHFFKIKFEKFYSKLLIRGKKHYVGWLVWKEGKVLRVLDDVGFEMKRSDTPLYFKESQKRTIEAVLSGGKEAGIKVARDCLERIKEQEIKDIAFPTAVKKKLSDYKTVTSVGQGIELYNNILGHNVIDVGNKINWIYVKKVIVNGRTYKSSVFAWPSDRDIPENVELVVDYDEMKRRLESTLLKVLEVWGVKSLERMKNTKITSYFQ